MKDWNLSDTNDVKELITQGDSLAQKVIYEALSGKMLVVCNRYIRDRDEARDLMHDGFIKVFDHLASFNFKGSFEGWVKRIIVNTVLDYLKRRKRLILEDDETSFDKNHSRNDYEQTMENEYSTEKAEIFMSLIRQLPTSYRLVFNLYVLEGYSHKMIAEELGVHEGTSKSNLFKAKETLRKLYKEHVRTHQRL
jgi:RNA polymerase sigma-70 factor (ECF subfamily)